MILDRTRTLVLGDEAATAALGAAVGRALKRHEAVLLSGPLGAGKSALARGLVRALAGAVEEVPSPTFTLVQHYETPVPLAHFDLYRLEDAAEALEIGLEEALDHGAAAVEWPERLNTAEWARLAPDRLSIELAHAGDARRARLTPCGAWKGRRLDVAT